MLSEHTKRVSFSNDVASIGSEHDSSSSIGSVETYPGPASISSISHDSAEVFDEAAPAISLRKSSSSSSSSSRNSVLKKRYSKLAYSVQGVREGQIKKVVKAGRRL